jgi:hypothetical protein
MTVLERTAFSDLETLEALQGHPDLLAIADALVATQKRRRRRLPFARIGLAAAVIVVAAVVALVSPWQGEGGGFVARALAALGDGQVIHVVSLSDLPGQTLVDLQSGAEQPVQARTEIWFDSARGLERSVSSSDGRVTQEELQTPQGAWTQDGRVYTCAWIAAHPVAATRARVSCNANGDNGTTPRHIPEPLPALDPALSGFVSGYRDALANGSAQRDGTGTVDGRPVEWLSFQEQSRTPVGAPAQSQIERVAVDTQSLKPVLVETLVNGQQVGETRIVSIETLDRRSVDFSTPKQVPPGPSGSSVSSQRTVAAGDAAAALGGQFLWAGQSVDGLQLNETMLQQIVTGYGRDSGIPYGHSTGVELVYGGPTDPSSSADYVTVRESLQAEMLYGFDGPERQAPAQGSMLVSSSQVMTAAPGTSQAVPTGKTLWYGLLEQDGVYVSSEATSKTLLLDSAHALTRFQGTK